MLESRATAGGADDHHVCVSPEVDGPLRSMTQCPLVCAVSQFWRELSSLAPGAWCLEADGIRSLARYIGGHQLPGIRRILQPGSIFHLVY